MKNITKLPLLLFSIIFLTIPKLALAHCPLCVAGAGALAVLAASLGVSTIVVGLFIGAFSLALGIWIARSIRKKIIKFQNVFISLIIAISTIVPIMPLIKEYRPLYLDIYGKYGTVLHNTYALNLYIVGAILGSILFFASQYLSDYLTKLRGKKLPFQSMIVAFSLLVIFGIILQLTI